MSEFNSRGPRRNDARQQWEKRRNERILKYKKEQNEAALAKFNSTKHIQPADVRRVNRQALLEMWDNVKDGQNSLDRNQVLKEITRRAKKIDPESKDPVQTLANWVTNNTQKQD